MEKFTGCWVLILRLAEVQKLWKNQHFLTDFYCLEVTGWQYILQKRTALFNIFSYELYIH